MTKEERIKAKRKAKRAKKRRRRIILFTIEGILLLGLILFLFVNSKLSLMQFVKLDIAENKELDAATLKWMEGYQTIAIFGVDARDNKTLTKGTLADMNMICTINNDTGEIRLVSVYRDTYVDVNGSEKFNKLNYAYAAGGPDQAIDTLNRNLDLNISQFVTVNWKAVADAINILGGIDIEITDKEFAQINGFITETVNATGVASVHLTSAGWNHLDGVQAVAYSRLRLMDTDYQRTERQRKVVALTLEKAKQADFITLNGLIELTFPNIATNLEVTEMLLLAKNINKYHMGTNAGFPFEKNSKRMGSLGDCVIPLGLADNVTELHRILYDREDYQPSNRVLRLDQVTKDNTGLGGSGGAVTANTGQASGGGGSSATQAVATAAPEPETPLADVVDIDVEESEDSSESESDEIIDDTQETTEDETELQSETSTEAESEPENPIETQSPPESEVVVAPNPMGVSDDTGGNEGPMSE